MKSRMLNLKESRRLVWTTLLELLVVGAIVSYFNLMIVVFIAGPIALQAMVRFWVSSVGIPKRLYSGVVYRPFVKTVLISGVGAFATFLGGFLPIAIGLSTVCALSIMCVYPKPHLLYH